MMKLFMWVLALVLFSLPSYAEIIAGYTVEWLAHQSALVAVATPQSITDFKGEQELQFVKIRYRLDNVLKGPLSTGDIVTVYHFNISKSPLAVFAPFGKATQILIFCTIARNMFRDIDGKYVFTENQIFISAYGIDQPLGKLFTPDFHLLTTYAELLKRSKAQISYEQSLEHQYWKGIITEKRIEIPRGSEAFHALFAGSSCYLLIPDYQEKKEIVGE